jgi:hypothetical protein
MARSRIHDTKQDLVTDSGSILWSIIRGEQLVLPAYLSFIHDVNNNFTYSACVVEADNIEGQQTIPERIKENGQSVELTVALPTFLGEWEPATAYHAGESVTYNDVYYTLSVGAGRVNSTPPPDDKFWFIDKPNKVLVRFPSTLTVNWAVLPTPSRPVYGFFELTVTETNPYFPRIWKPVRGVVEILYSPRCD